jgi:predicted permease
MDKGPGFETSSLISFGINPLQNGSSQADAGNIIRRVLEDTRASADIQTSAVCMVPLLTGGTWNSPMTVQARDRFTTDREVHLNMVSEGFFTTLGVRLIAGRDFDERESFPAAGVRAPVAIVNEAFAKRYFPGRSPLGAHIGEGSGPTVEPDVEVVGVVANISYRGVRDDWEQAYFPLVGPEGGTFYVRARGNPDAVIPSIRSIVRAADSSLPITFVRTVDEQVNRSLNTERILAALSSSFSALALLLSLVGIYGVVSFAVAQRTHEIGIRMALGGTRAATVWMMLRSALVMIVAGIVIALPCVWVLGRYVEAQLYGVKPTDPTTVALAVGISCLATLVSALIPAQRASAVNPAQALRCD